MEAMRMAKLKKDHTKQCNEAKAKVEELLSWTLKKDLVKMLEEMNDIVKPQ